MDDLTYSEPSINLFELLPPDQIGPPSENLLGQWRDSHFYESHLPDEEQVTNLQLFVSSLLCEGQTFKLSSTQKRPEEVVRWIPGHLLGDKQQGPKHAKVMIIGKCPGLDDQNVGRMWTGPVAKLLASELARLKVAMSECYGTAVLKYAIPSGIKALPRHWMSEAGWILRHEINAVKPEFILVCGVDGIKALFGPHAKLDRYKGIFEDAFGAKLMATSNPSDILRNPEKTDQFRADLRRFCDAVRGEAAAVQDTKTRVVLSLDELKKVVDEHMQYSDFAIDCEWSGQNWTDGQLLTIQFACKPGEAVVVVLRSLVSKFEFNPSISLAIAELRRLFCRDKVGIIGHNFRADLKWLKDIGLDLTHQFCRNGFDTMLASHLLAESNEHNLTACTLRETSMGKYDRELFKLIDEGHTHATVPDSVLWPYAGKDADATYRLFTVYSERLLTAHCEYCSEARVSPADAIYPPNEGEHKAKGVWYPTLLNLFKYIVLPVNEALVEMEMTGMLVDMKQVEEMALQFAKKRDELLAELREVISDPEFNPRSTRQIQRLLYCKPGTEWFDGKVYHCLGITPVKCTNKAVKWTWSELAEANEVEWLEDPVYTTIGEKVSITPAGWFSKDYSPSTDNESLSMLLDEYEHKELNLLRDFRLVDQICKAFLCEAEEQDDGEMEYEKGIGAYIRPDGRIMYNLSQLTETGRYRCFKFNCFSADTEVLTENGWTLFPEVVEGVKLAQYWEKDGSITFDYPKAYIKSFSDRLLNIKTDTQIDLLVTPDHDCLVRDKNGLFKKLKAEKYTDGYHQICAGKYEGGNLEFPESQIVILAAMQADGYILPGGQVEFAFSKKRKADRICWALNESGLKYRASKDTLGRYRMYLPKQEGLDYIKSWKFFDSRILQLSAKSLVMLADELFFWDGCWTRKNTYGSSIKNNSDWVQIVQLLVGRRARVREYWWDKRYDKHWAVDVTRRDYSWTTHHTIHEQAGGMTYCVTMPAGTVIVRRNGKVAITGQCQQLPKGKEGELKRIFKGEAPKIRSVFMPAPGHVFIEADFKSAELFAMAYLAGDAKMKEDLSQKLPSGKEVSLHSVRAVSSFKLPMTLEEFEEKRKDDPKLEGLRTSAKSTSFGVPYGRGPSAICRSVQREGVECTVAEAKGWINDFFDTYLKVKEYLDWCHRSVVTPGHVRSPFGRMRRFHPTDDDRVRAAQEREAGNVNIQGTIADTLSLALVHLVRERDKARLRFRIVLPVHDAVLLEVPYEEVQEAMKLLNLCMTERAEVPGIGLKLGVDIAVYSRWGEKAGEDTLAKCGFTKKG